MNSGGNWQKRLAISANSPLQKLNSTIAERAGVELWVKRDDLLHPLIGGNKWRKLKYNIDFFFRSKSQYMITFGGAFSNHIFAVAATCHLLDIPSVGIMRGDGMDDNNPTLQFAAKHGMTLHFVDRQAYRLKENADQIKEIIKLYPNAYILPEGGTNSYALPGVSEIVKELLRQHESQFDYIALPAGTGGTAAGILKKIPHHTKVIAFSALKGHFLEKEIFNLAGKRISDMLILNSDYHFGGYAKFDDTLISFTNTFYKEYGIILDPIYNGKTVFGLFDLIKNGFFPKGSKIVWIHTGGIQGVKGFNYLHPQHKIIGI